MTFQFFSVVFQPRWQNCEPHCLYQPNIFFLNMEVFGIYMENAVRVLLICPIVPQYDIGNISIIFFSDYRCNSTVLFICLDRKSTRLNSSHVSISYAVFCLKKKKLMYSTEL